LPAIRSLGAALVAISPELPGNTLTMAEKHAIPIDIPSDATSEVLKAYRLWFAVPAEVNFTFGRASDRAIPSAIWLRAELAAHRKRT